MSAGGHVLFALLASLALGAHGFNHRAAVGGFLATNLSQSPALKRLQPAGGQQQTPAPGSEAAAAAIQGVSINSAGDLPAFLSALGYGVIMSVSFFVGASFLRKEFPMVYSYNVLKGKVQGVAVMPTDELFGWVRAALFITPDEVAKNAGLDAGMLIEYLNLCIRIMATMAIPLCFILIPLHVWFGGWAAWESQDRLSFTGLHNVVHGSNICWLHSIIAVMVVLYVERSIFHAQKMFLPKRFQWLKDMPAPRSNTILVEGIPWEYRTDKKLQSFFEDLFPGEGVESAFVVKKTEQLLRLITFRDSLKDEHHAAVQKWETEGKAKDKRPRTLNYYGHFVDAIDYYEEQVKAAEARVVEERKRIMDAAKAANSSSSKGDQSKSVLSNATDYDYIEELMSDTVYSTSGFVTFKTRQEKELIVHTKVSGSEKEWIVQYPPEPSDVLYNKLMMDPARQAANKGVGMLLLVGLFWSFIPFVIFISQLTSLDNLESIEFLKPIVTDPVIAPLIEGIGSTLGLTIFMSLLPTLIHMIYSAFFSLKSDRWAQLEIQWVYYTFLVLFTLFATIIGRSVFKTGIEILSSPASIFHMLGESLPQASHWYLCLVATSASSHAMHFLRYSNLGKFLAFRKVYGDEDIAHEKSEPEDQDYYGIGGRTARMSLEVTIALVFCTFNPIMLIVILLDLVTMRLSYGYLLVFAETKKADLGGYFWVGQLNFLYLALTIYATMMTGVLGTWMAYEEDVVRQKGPTIIAGCGLAYCIWMWYKFQHAMHWEALPYTELAHTGKLAKPSAYKDKYQQKELLG